MLMCGLLLSDAAIAQQANVKCTQAQSGEVVADHCSARAASPSSRRMARDTSLATPIMMVAVTNPVALSSKALLLDVQVKSGGRKFQVNTPQAIAAVRGTRWAVDVAEGKTSVFVVHGRVRVGRRSPGDRQVVLGPGEGVDVEAATPLVVKRWAPARVSALMARLGQ